MAIVDEDIERVRAATSIVDLVGQDVALRRVGRSWQGLCPFHAERTPSFHVREETGRYKCFGCGVSGDVFRFVQDMRHVDFVGSVEHLAAAAGIQLRYTTGGESRDRQRRKRLVEAMEQAIEWYHQRLLTAPDARPARDYLRARGLAGDIARKFRLGWAPEGWDELSRSAGLARDQLHDTGLAFTNRRNKMQDAFRARVMFPIFNENAEPVAFGGRVLPGSSDPAKYKNSPETPIYQKSRVLYGLNWSKADVVAQDQVIVCEGYTDVIGFHRAGLARAVATCGTALTEEHVRLLKRFASRVVLAFDADAAGQGAAERFYEWEDKYRVEVSVARLPEGRDPADLADRPDDLQRMVDDAMPFLGFRLDRVLGSRHGKSPEQRARLAERAMSVVNEHPNVNVRKLYAGQVATSTGLPVADLVKLAEQRGGRLSAPMPARRVRPENAEFVCLALLSQQWEPIAEWLIEPLFTDEVNLRAFRSLAASNGRLDQALELADPEARDVLERAAVSETEADPRAEAWNLLAAAVRRELAQAQTTDPDEVRDLIQVRRWLDELDVTDADVDGAERLLHWLDQRSEERG